MADTSLSREGRGEEAGEGGGWDGALRPGHREATGHIYQAAGAISQKTTTPGLGRTQNFQHALTPTHFPPPTHKPPLHTSHTRTFEAEYMKKAAKCSAAASEQDPSSIYAGIRNRV